MKTPKTHAARYSHTRAFAIALRIRVGHVPSYHRTIATAWLLNAYMTFSSLRRKIKLMKREKHIRFYRRRRRHVDVAMVHITSVNMSFEISCINYRSHHRTRRPTDYEVTLPVGYTMEIFLLRPLRIEWTLFLNGELPQGDCK